MKRTLQKTVSVLGALVLLLPAAGLYRRGLLRVPAGGELGHGQYLEELETSLRGGLPGREELREFSLRLRLVAGNTEQNGIFICDDELIRNVDPPVEAAVRENTAAVLEFADNIGIPTYFALIPTASAIRQQSLAPYARSQVFNQRAFIEEVGASMVGRVTVADVYSALFGAREQYVYYRTENNLTSLGGYHVYTVLGGRLLEGTAGGSLRDYDIQYVAGEYYGDLYDRSPYKNITPDTLSLYHYTPSTRQYLVTHTAGGVSRSYHSLYPMSRLALGHPTGVYLGGLSAITDVHSNTAYDNGLLIFGDKTALAYVPFLANHYASITVVDLFQLEPADYSSINPQDYSQVLFCYSVESFMYNNVPTRALRFLDNFY